MKNKSRVRKGAQIFTIGKEHPDFKELTQKRFPQNYYKCTGCGECVDINIPRGKCNLCGCQNWIACTI